MNLSTENYYTKQADTEYMSVSQYKAFKKCEHRAYAQYVTGEYVLPEKECFLSGNYVGTKFESHEAHERFLEENKDLLYAKNGKGLLKKFSDLDRCYERASQDESFMCYMTGDHEQIFTSDLFGVPWKVRIDCINHKINAITDLKTCKDFSLVWDDVNKCKVPFYDAYNYYLQLAVYQKVYQIATGNLYSCHIAAVTKEQEPDIDIIDFNVDPRAVARMKHELLQVEQYLPVIMAIKSGEREPVRCGKCDYCKRTKKITEFTFADGGVY